MAMHRDKPDFGVIRSEPLFATHRRGTAHESGYSSGELQLTRTGDLIVYTKDSGHWVALMIGEMVALYHQWTIIAAADVPRLVGDPARAFEVFRQKVPVAEDEHSIDFSKRL